jgi:5-formyltetrahydrofolate cyclo-ligase
VNDKAALRARQRALRRALNQPRAGEEAAARFLAAVPLAAGAVVAGYWPMGSELDSRPLLEALAARGHTVLLPAPHAEAQPLTFRPWQDDAAPADDPGILIVPLLAFDRAGWRLGQGGGHYDRTLAGLRAKRPVLAIGLAYAAQEVPAVPHNAYDQRVDWIVTEREAWATG